MSTWKATANKSSGEGFEQPPPGNHAAICVAIIDLGTQENNYQGNVKYEHRAFFVWELVNAKSTTGKNFLCALDLTISLNVKAKLRKWVEARTSKAIPDGSDYDISQELGQPCLLSVVQNGQYVKVDGMGAVPAGFTIGAPQNTPIIMSLDDYRNGMKVPEWIPWSYGSKVSDIISRCQELCKPNQGAPSSPATATNSSPQAPNRPIPPRPPAPPSATGTSDRKFWVALDNGQVEEMMESNSQNFLTMKGLDPAKVLVLVDGTEEWKTAESFGLKTSF